ncbi:SAM-dependent DNA methyltransferase [Niveispirillum sp.]|uniref:SAM-dependent DNA methyltransferase n=1 Tax=Niveispirillum sp. TaxID=1917217 RepID=UPI001B4881FE|nr:SAM-dependent DNA methyltransferase [Niveispirillum sp.]MBP7337696.1 SAM-dependent DNA methyltransferase [Niveispirillum sp.]
MSQNTSSAVMAQRRVAPDSLDYFPTPPWGTRALIERADSHTFLGLDQLTVWEPACGEGWMARPLGEYFGRVVATDCHDYGCGYPVHDFLMPFLPDVLQGRSPHWIITNPPYVAAEAFAMRALEVATDGVSLLLRTGWLEGVGRYERLFRKRPPTLISQFTERLPMHKARVDPEGGTATAYVWITWLIGWKGEPIFSWIPPCRAQLERDSDYLLVTPVMAAPGPLEQLMLEGSA